MIYYTTAPDRYTSYKEVLVTREEQLLAAEKQRLCDYEPLTVMHYPGHIPEPGVAYPSPKRRKGDPDMFWS